MDNSLSYTNQNIISDTQLPFYCHAGASLNIPSFFHFVNMYAFIIVLLLKKLTHDQHPPNHAHIIVFSSPHTNIKT